ncbi:MAG: tripartite tricarboxylate transporter substrate binding protein [Ramlibacter sp.]|nr:tripartite tricarboxylate transporter substrate binding protein [Ramlibacter sp.]
MSALLVLTAVPESATAQSSWPDRPIKLIVPFSPGGSTDTLGRLIGRHLSTAFGQPVVIDNRPGAGGMIGSQAVAKSPPDGYTLVISGIASHVIAPAAPGALFDPMKDFTHIAMIGGPPVVLVVNAAVPVQDVKGFIAYVASKPQGINWASSGQGTHAHLIGETFRAANNLKMVHISYKGGAQAVVDLLGNQIPAAFMALPSANQHILNGKLRALATTASKRLPEHPNVPTFAELGYPQLTARTWFSLSGPPGMPKPLVDRINLEVRRGLQTPALKQQLALESIESDDFDSATFTRFVQSEIDRWTPLAKAVSKSDR